MTFIEFWNSFKTEDGQSVPLPDDMEVWQSLSNFRRRGVAVTDLPPLVRVAMKANHVPLENRWVYFCGIVWNVIRTADDMSTVVA